MSDDLLAIAREALGAYDLEVRDCSFAAQSFNTVFRVDAADGAAYALRVGATLRIHADGCEELETSWVNQLHDAGLPVARPVAARDGATVVGAGERRCVLFEWVPGHNLWPDPPAEGMHAAGALTARVHDHAAAHAPAAAPPGALVADRVLYFRAPARLDELQPAYGTVLAEALERAQRALDALWHRPPHAAHLLHGDVQPGNVLISGGDATLIDFQDVIWGFEIQDVAIAEVLLTETANAEELRRAFRAGYERIRPWPEAEPETFAALRVARHLNVLNYGLSVRKPGLDAWVTRHARPVVDWMTAG